jgi:hypothetical protein
MHKLIFPFLCFLVSYSLTGQKVNTKDFDVTASYIQLPVKGLDPTISTYTVMVEGNDTDLKYYGQSLSGIKESIRLDGYQRVEGGASLIIVVNVGTPQAGSPTTVTEEKVIDKVATKFYSYKLDMNVYSSIKLKNAQGGVIDELPVNSSEPHKTTTIQKC